MTFTPTILYIKQHSKTGLLYFGKTCKHDPYEYLGSGRHWMKHITTHGRKFVITLWVSDTFMDKNDLIEFAEFFSDFFDIVKNRKWSNQRPENGIDGAPFGNEVTVETREKISKTNTILFNDPDWKNKNQKSRKQQGITMSKIRNSNEWQLKQYKECPQCGKTFDPANYKRWHDNKCKER